MPSSNPHHIRHRERARQRRPGRSIMLRQSAHTNWPREMFVEQARPLKYLQRLLKWPNDQTPSSSGSPHVRGRTNGPYCTARSCRSTAKPPCNVDKQALGRSRELSTRLKSVSDYAKPFFDILSDLELEPNRIGQESGKRAVYGSRVTTFQTVLGSVTTSLH